MAYHTMLFLFFFLPCVLLFYQLMPQKCRPFVLLAAGYAFFFSFSRMLFIYLFAATGVIYLAGRGIARVQVEYLSRKKGMERSAAAEWKKKCIRRKRIVLVMGILFLVGTLFSVKYYNFFAQNLNACFLMLSIPLLLEQKTILQPIGISFYTLQAIGYMIDVYEGKIAAEKKFSRLALFMAFFPQIMEGPISRYDQTADKLYQGNKLETENLMRGIYRILWGLFKKMLIADRLSVMVNAVYADYTVYGGVVSACAAAAYTVQLYMEFSGCMDIVIGVGEMFGVELPENFRQPFFAKSAAEFWRRWHITLGAWLKDYIFYPVSLSGKVKKLNGTIRQRFGKHAAKVFVSAAALFPVWLGNGLWHGPRWNYIFYGLYYFSLILLGIIMEPVFVKINRGLHIQPESKVFGAVRIFRTMIIVVIGEMFFRAPDLSAGIGMFRYVFADFAPERLIDGTLLALGLDQKDFLLIGMAMIVVFIVDLLHEKGISIRKRVMEAPLPLRWSAYYVLMLSILIFGAYGDGYTTVDLIYAGF